MNFFKRTKQQPITTISLVKEVKLTKTGTETIYYVELNGKLVSNSLFMVYENSEIFFNNLIKNKGKHTEITTIKEVVI